MENNIIIVFNNRNKSMQFANYLKRMGIPNKLINTPRELSISCGVSIVFNSRYLSQVKDLINKMAIRSIVRMYVIYNNKNYKPIL